MPPETRLAYVDLDNWITNAGGTNWGNGKGARLQIGEATFQVGAGRNRSQMRIPLEEKFQGITDASQITAAPLRIKIKGGCFGTGANPRMFIKQATPGQSFSENDHTVDCGVTSAGGSSGEWPGMSTTETNRGSYSGNPADNAWIGPSLLNMVRALFTAWKANPYNAQSNPGGVKAELWLVLVAANGDLTADDENTGSRRLAFHSRHSGASSQPYLELTVDLTIAPNVPTDMAPTGGALAVSTEGTRVTVEARYTHPESKAGDRYQVRAWANSVTQEQVDAGTAGTPMKDTGAVAATIAHNSIRQHTLTAMPARTDFKWDIRFSHGNTWGPWSPLQSSRTAYKPTAVQLSVEPGTLTPRLYASISSQDPLDNITRVDEYIYQDPAQGTTITKWAPPSASIAIGGAPTRSEVTYGGSALVFGQQYRRRVVVYNRDGVPSDLTANTYFTQYEAIGPEIRIGSAAGPIADLATKIDTRTPTFNLSDPADANIDQARLWIWHPTLEVLLWDSGVVSFASAANRNIAVPAGILEWGMEPRIEGAIRVTGNANIGPPSQRARVHLNVAPGSPYPLTVLDAVLNAEGVWVTTVEQPTIRIPFRDVDKDLGYAEAPVRQEVEVRSLADAHVGASPFTDTSTPEEDWQVPAGLLLLEGTRKIRANYDDSANVRSALSDYLLLKWSEPPFLELVSPEDEEVLVAPRPTVTYAYGSPGGKAQATRRIEAFVDGNAIYDTGVQATQATQHRPPAGALPNNKTITWRVTVTDTDGLVTVLEWQNTTAFETPPPVTGLVVTQDAEQKALLLEWDETTLEADEFDAYVIRARVHGVLVDVATIPDPQQTSYLWRLAPHNVDVVVRVRQSNGWDESEPLEETALLDLPGDWAVGPNALVQLWVGGERRTLPTDRIWHAPPGRPYKLGITRGTFGFEGQIALYATAEDLRILREWQVTSTAIALKLEEGDVYVALVSLGDEEKVAHDLWRLNLSFVEIGPAESAI